MLDADALIETLKLEPHPEGGYYRETFRDETGGDNRARSTAIYYLLKDGQSSHWHRVDAVEMWHWYAGAPLELGLSRDGQSSTRKTLGCEIGSGQRPQVIIPEKYWQSATPRGSWTLVGCTVAPGFEFSGFELAPKGWQPADWSSHD